MTLRFIGPTPEPRIPTAAGALSPAVAGRRGRSRPALGGAGAFPDPYRPRCAVARDRSPGRELAALTVAVDRELAARGWPTEDRPFRPHLTLARSDGIGTGRRTRAPGDRGGRRPGRPLDGRPDRPVRERHRRWAGPLRPARRGRPRAAARLAVAGLCPAGPRRPHSASIERPGPHRTAPPTTLRPSVPGRSPRSTTPASQRVRVVLALGMVNLVLAVAAVLVASVPSRSTDPRLRCAQRPGVGLPSPSAGRGGRLAEAGTWPSRALDARSSSSTRTGSRGPGTTSRPTSRCRPSPSSIPGTGQPIGPDDLAPLFPMALIEQVVSKDREIEIPEPVLDAYRLYRPSPLFRAHRLEQALDTPAHIYYKYEGGSPSGSHKPNTALAAGLLQQGRGRHPPRDRDRRRPVGQRARLRRRRLRARGQGLHGPRQLRPEAVPADPDGDVRRGGRRQPVADTEYGRKVLGETPGPHRVARASRSARRSRTRSPIPGRSTRSGRCSTSSCSTRPSSARSRSCRWRWPARSPTSSSAAPAAARTSPGSPSRGSAARSAAAGQYRVIAVEPEAAPSLTRGVYAYDFGDTAQMTPLVKMHTLGHDFIPEPIHAGGLRYHGMSPLVSLLKEHGYIEALSVHQRASFESGRPVRPDRGHPAGARADPRHQRRDRRGARGEGRRRAQGHPVQPVRSRPLRPERLRALPERPARGLRVPGREGRRRRSPPCRGSDAATDRRNGGSIAPCPGSPAGRVAGRSTRPHRSNRCSPRNAAARAAGPTSTPSDARSSGANDSAG